VARAERFFSPLLSRDAAGASWFGPLLRAAPYARDRLGDLVDAPGWLVTPLAVATASGRLGAFGYQSAPSRELLRWYVDHPDRLTWPADAALTPETMTLRRALLCDEPPGAQAKAQERAHELILTRPPFSSAWWLFEGMADIDCVLISDRLVLTIDAVDEGEPPPVTPWYPPRTRLVRALEAARALAEHRRWGSIVISSRPLEQATDAYLESTLAQAAPHLDAQERAQLHAAYLGNVTWEAAEAAVAQALGPR
jgi:hypothetical protein